MIDDDFYSQENIAIKNIYSACQFNLCIEKLITKDIIPKHNTKPECLKKTLTIFGEYHNVDVPCGDEYAISVADYIRRTLQHEKKIKIFLEYDYNACTTSLITSINSINIREILSSLTPDEIKEYVIPVDCRDFYLGVEHNRDLYYNLNMDADYIRTNFIEKFFAVTFSEIPKLSVKYTKILDNYIKTLIGDFSWLNDSWEIIVNPPSHSGKVPYKLVMLRYYWARLVDFFILTEIFKSDDTIEYICLIGDNHRINIQKYISSTERIESKTQTATAEKCVSLTEMTSGILLSRIQSYKFVQTDLANSMKRISL